MEILLLLILLGLITYLTTKRSATNLNKTPIWLLWLVMMTPAVIWSAWLLVYGEDKPIPIILVILPCVFCTFLYFWLIQKGMPQSPVANQEATTKEIPNNPEIIENPRQEAVKIRPINKTEETALRNCFSWAVYYLQQIDYSPQAIICRGKLRTIPEEAYKTIKKNVEEVFGDRFLILFQETSKGQPFFALVPNVWAVQRQLETQPLIRPWLALGLLFLTILTTSLFGLELNGLTSEKIEANPQLIFSGLPYSLSIVAIFGLHEISHYFAAVFYKIRTTLPYFIPFPFFLGTFGAFIQMRSPFPHRKALFDISIAGPIGGLIITIPLLIWGLSMSDIVPISEKSGLLYFEALNPRFSLLMSILAKIALGNQLIPTSAINLHPIAIAGYIGLLVTALNLMPIGQLDGGHIVHAVFGQPTAITIGQITRFLMFILAFVEPTFLIWAIIFLFLPVTDQPALNDVTELDNWRDFSGILCLVFLMTILLPLPGTIAHWLHI